MKRGMRDDLGLIILLAIGAALGLAGIELACNLLLTHYGPLPHLPSDTRHALDSQAAVRRHLLSPDPRLRFMATTLRDWGVLAYESRPPRVFDATVRAELPDYRHLGLLRGQRLFDGPFRFSSNVDDVYEMRGAASGKLKYRVHYVTDAHGRRVTQTSVRAGAKLNILFMGCSYTFGEGVATQDTFPAKVGALLPAANTHNFGVHGHSPAHTLWNLRAHGAKYLAGVDPNLPTLVVYTMMEAHMSRIVGTSSHLRFPQADGPYVHAEEAGLEVSETFTQSSLPHAFYRWFGSTSFARYTGLELPPIGESHLELAADILHEVRERVRVALPRFKGFYVASYPGGIGYFRQLMPFLRARGLGILDYTDVAAPLLLGTHSDLGEDPHPSAEAYDMYAHLLVADLAPEASTP